MKENKVINSAEWLLKPMPSDEVATSAERLSLVSESNTTELQDVPTKSKGETRSQLDEVSLQMPEYLKGLYDAIKGPHKVMFLQLEKPSVMCRTWRLQIRFLS